MTGGPNAADLDADARFYSRRHIRMGWWSLLAFLSLGIALEGMHGFKVGWYLDVSNDTRRLMLTLAHAHGTLFSLIHIAFGFTVVMRPSWPTRSRSHASRCLMAATVLVPVGFLLGGLITHAGDPGLGIVLVPVGALLLLVAVFLTARQT